jgi:hypothetical protein
MNVTPGVLTIYHPGDTTDDTKLSSGDIVVMVARGDGLASPRPRPAIR